MLERGLHWLQSASSFCENERLFLVAPTEALGIPLIGSAKSSVLSVPISDKLIGQVKVMSFTSCAGDELNPP